MSHDHQNESEPPENKVLLDGYQRTQPLVIYINNDNAQCPKFP